MTKLDIDRFYLPMQQYLLAEMDQVRADIQKGRIMFVEDGLRSANSRRADASGSATIGSWPLASMD